MSSSSSVDVAALQRQQDDRIAELTTLYDAGLLTASDLEHAVQREREAFQRKLLAHLEEEEEEDEDEEFANGDGGATTAEPTPSLLFSRDEACKAACCRWWRPSP